MSADASRKIILGSRGSELARAQAAMVVTALQQAWPQLEVELKVIRTSGDEKEGSARFQPANRTGSSRGELAPLEKTQAGSSHHLGRKGLFTGEIERVLAAGEIDIAVHSAKDLPSEATSGLEVRSVLPRAAVDDVLIRKTSGIFPRDGVVATGSVRRQHQLRWKCPGIKIVDLRGNVPTRLRKLISNEWDAIVLARAGVERLGYDLSGGFFAFEDALLHVEILASDEFLPAGGQGVIALQVRGADEKTNAIVEGVNNPGTFLCLRAEREFLRLLQGDCSSPVGVLATIEKTALKLRAQVFEPGRLEPRVGAVEGSAENGVERLAAELMERINGG